MRLPIMEHGLVIRHGRKQWVFAFSFMLVTSEDYVWKNTSGTLHQRFFSTTTSITYSPEPGNHSRPFVRIRSQSEKEQMRGAPKFASSFFECIGVRVSNQWARPRRNILLAHSVKNVSPKSFFFSSLRVNNVFGTFMRQHQSCMHSQQLIIIAPLLKCVLSILSVWKIHQ